MLGVTPSRGTFGGQVRTGADNSGFWVSLLVGGHLADTCGQVRSGASGSSDVTADNNPPRLAVSLTLFHGGNRKSNRHLGDESSEYIALHYAIFIQRQ